ncbi:MAG: hypothetical protein JXQ29_17940 [Planctomycetes bacterium]|nr:hypothetical protein [Planctomycetota bacterium]
MEKRARARVRRIGARLVLLLAMGAAAPAFADEIHLKSGGKIVGKVEEVTAERVRVKTPFGVQSVARADIVRIDYKPTPAEEFAARLEQTDRQDVDALVALADWARSAGLKKEAERTLRLVIAVDPNHRVAREALGHVLFEGVWMTRKEAEEAEQRRAEADRRLRGLIRYQGEWVTREEMEAREKGWVKVGDRWLPPEEANRARGLVQVGGEWLPRHEAEARRRAGELEQALGVKLETAATTRFRVFSEFGVDQARAVADAGEKALGLVRERVGWLEPVWKPEEPCELVLLRTPGSYMQLVDRIGAATNQPPGWADYAKRQTSFYTVSPPASVQHAGGRRAPDMIFTAIHHVGHIALHGIHPGYTYPPVWLDEGFAVWIEHATLKESLTACSTTGYGVASPRQDKWSQSAHWKANLKAGLADGSVVGLERLMVARLNELGWMEIAKAWSVVDWWIQTDRERFLRFVKEVRQRYPRYDKHAEAGPADFLRFQTEALEEVFGLSPAGAEKAWRSHVSAGS